MLKLFKKRSTNEDADPGTGSSSSSSSSSRAVPDDQSKGEKKKQSGYNHQYSSSMLPDREEKGRSAGPSQAIETLTSAVADLDLGEAGPQDKPTKKKQAINYAAERVIGKWFVRYCISSYCDRDRRNRCYQESTTRSPI